MLHPVPKPESKAAEKADARMLRDAYRRIVYRLVSKRDAHRCRSCGSRGPGLHHHHLRYRSKQGACSERNLCLLCPRCHADVHAHRVSIDGDDANHALGFVRGKEVK